MPRLIIPDSVEKMTQRASTEPAACEIRQGVVLRQLKKAVCYGFNPAESGICEFNKNPSSRDGIYKSIAARFQDGKEIRGLDNELGPPDCNDRDQFVGEGAGTQDTRFFNASLLLYCLASVGAFSSAFGFCCARTFIRMKQKYPTWRITSTMTALIAMVAKFAPSYNDHIVTMMVVQTRPNKNFGKVIATSSCYHNLPQTRHK